MIAIRARTPSRIHFASAPFFGTTFQGYGGAGFHHRGLVSKAKGLGADARLRVFEKRPHGFFNFGRGDGKDYEATVQEMDQFLVELGWLKSK